MFVRSFTRSLINGVPGFQIQPQTEGLAEAFHLQANVMKAATFVASDQMNIFWQAEVHLGAQERPDFVRWDMLSMRQQVFEHLVP